MALTDYFQTLPETFSEQIQYKTDMSQFDSGQEQRRSRWSTGRTIYSYSYPNAIDSQITDIWDFYKSRLGSFDYFYLVVPPEETYTTAASGSTNITLTTATKPSPENIRVFVDDIETWDWDYVDASKRIDFDSPQTGSVDVYYYEMKLVRFANDVASRDWMIFLVTSQSLDFITVSE